MTYTATTARSIVANISRMTVEELRSELATADAAVAAARRGGQQALLAKRVQGSLQYALDRAAGNACANCAETREVHATVSFPGDCRTFVPMD